MRLERHTYNIGLVYHIYIYNNKIKQSIIIIGGEYSMIQKLNENNKENIVSSGEHLYLNNGYLDISTVRSLLEKVDQDGMRVGNIKIEIRDNNEIITLISDKLLNPDIIIAILSIAYSKNLEVQSISMYNTLDDNYAVLDKVGDNVVKMTSSFKLERRETKIKKETLNKLVEYRMVLKDKSLATLIRQVFSKFSGYTFEAALSISNKNKVYIFYNNGLTCFIYENTVICSKLTSAGCVKDCLAEFSEILFRTLEDLEGYRISEKSSNLVI